MQLILESERIVADPNKKMSVVQTASSVKEHLSGDPPTIEPDKNKEDGVIDSEDSEISTEVMSKNKATIDDACREIGDESITDDNNVAEEVITDIAVNVATENFNKTNSEFISKSGAIMYESDQDISCETSTDGKNVTEEVNTDVTYNTSMANIEENNTKLVSKNKATFDDAAQDMSYETITDNKSVTEEVNTDVTVNTTMENLDENAKKATVEATIKTILDKGDKISLAYADTNSGLKKDNSENSNEEDEEPMEHLELSDNDDENDSKKSDNSSIKEEDGVKANILKCNTTDVADIPEKSLEEDILMDSPLNRNKDEEPMDGDMLNDSSEDIEKDEESKREEALLQNDNNKQSEKGTESIFGKRKEIKKTNEDYAMDHTVDSSDGKIDGTQTEDVAVEVCADELLEESLEDFINSTEVKTDPDLSDMDLSNTNKMCDLETSKPVEKVLEDETNISNLSDTAKLTEATPDGANNMETVIANVEISNIVEIAKQSHKKNNFIHNSSSHIDSEKLEESQIINKPTIDDAKKAINESLENIDKSSNNTNIDSCERSVDKTNLISDYSSNDNQICDSSHDNQTSKESDDTTIHVSPMFKNSAENTTTCDKPNCEETVDTTTLSSDKLSDDKQAPNESDHKSALEKSVNEKKYKNNTTCDKPDDEKANAHCEQIVDTTKLLSDNLSFDKPANNETNDTAVQEKSATGKIPEYNDKAANDEANDTIVQKKSADREIDENNDKTADEKTNENSPSKSTMVEKLAHNSADKAFDDLFRSDSPCTDEAVSEKCAKENIKITGAESEESRDCVMVEDDDDDNDIMVIDEDTSSKVDENTNNEDISIGTGESEEVNKQPPNEKNKGSIIEDDVVISTEIGKNALPKTEEKNNDEDSSQTKISSETDTIKCKDDKPLVALNFLNSFKTKITDMTRSDLEEFCILKIVEGVVDRSNLSDIKAKLKIMMQNVEEWRKKAMVLNKQNRDLQIVLRTVQEEQKKRADEIITPLKITRSVGMQVLMTENKTDPGLIRNRVQKRTIANVNTATLLKAAPGKTPPQIKNTKTPIPVPRLVPALNSSPSKPTTPRASTQVQNSTITSNNTGKGSTTPNGLRNYTQKADKRPYSVSIDLTDDEPPPAKQIATGKVMQPPVRLVPSQQLMAPGHRSPLLHAKQSASNPRQVYIPIGGPQGNIRPGQTIVFKTNQSNVRARQPGPGTIVRGSGPNVRTALPRNQTKHPAPLPQAYQQPQPPNWKALPPAPDLKISKIENGIVVSWKIDGYQEDSFEEIVSYQLYAYQETTAPASTYLWNKIGDIKALPLPMACTLTQFIAGYKYYFAVRAVDARSRIGPFSLPGSILLLNK